MGRLCAYCGGDHVVTQAEAARYGPDLIDEVPCPHCEGAGTISLMSTVCRYCGGDRVVSAAMAASCHPMRSTSSHVRGVKEPAPSGLRERFASLRRRHRCFGRDRI